MKPFFLLPIFVYLSFCVQDQSHSLVNSTGNALLKNQSATSSSTSPFNTNRGFPFIIPYNQTQECNIYGPICQTGSITVGIDLTSTITTTTMPCSSYLTSQSSYISNFNYFPDAIKPYWPDEWKIGFGRSPECTSYADVWRNQGKYTFSSCGSNDAIVTASPGVVLPHQIPPGVLRQVPFLVYECCGNCTLDVSEVRLYYFRDEAGNSSYCQANQTLVSRPTFSATSNEKRARTIPARSNIAIVSGYTFTSPSVYLEIVGTAAVADSCAPIGAVFTNPIIALPPGELMTYSPQFPFTVGQEYFDPNGVFGNDFLGFKKSLNIAELECPTFGVGPATSANGRVYRTYGPPYLPVVIPPRQIFSLDPAWEKYCVDFVSHAPGLRSFAIFDPPRILTPVEALLPPSTSAPAIVPASRTPDPVLTKEPQIQPARTTLPSIPKVTVVPVAPGVPLPESKLPLLVIASQSRPIAVETPGSRAPQFLAPLVNAPVDPAMSSNAERTLSPTLSDPQQIVDPEEDPQSLGAIIRSAFGGGDLTTGKSANRPNGVLSNIPPAETGNHVDATHSIIRPLTPNVLTIAGQIITANPSEIVIAGTTLLPDGPGMVISGTSISLAPSGNLFVDASPVPLINDQSPPPSFVFTIGGQTVVANPTGFTLGSSRIVPGNPQVTIFGIPISLNPSGILFVGGSSINLLDPALTSDVFTIGGQIVTANPAGFVLAGSKLVPGDMAITISGTPVSLNPSGILFVGGSSINLLDPALTSDVFTIGGQIFTANPAGFVLAGSKLVPGGMAITISGTPVSLNPSGVLFIGSSSTNLPAPRSSSKPFTVGGHIFTADSTGFELAGSTLLPGGAAITLSGTPISLAPSGVLIIGSSSITLPPKSLASDVFTAGGLTFTAESSAVVVDRKTLVPGGPAATISGTLISLKAGKDSGVLIVGSSTISLPSYTSAPNILTAGGLTFTSESSAIIVDGTTLLPGGPGAEISGTQISLKAGKDSEILIIGTSTINLPAQTSAPNIFTVGGLTLTAQPSDVVIDGSTLVAGGPGVTVSGIPVSLEPGGRSLMVGSREVPLATSSSTTGGGATLLGFESDQARSAEMPSFWRVAGLLGVVSIIYMLGGG